MAELLTTHLYLPSPLLSQARMAADERNCKPSAYIGLAIESHAKLDEAEITPDSTMFDVSTGRTTPFIDYHDSGIELLEKTLFRLTHSRTHAYGKAALSGLAMAEQVTQSLYVARGLVALNYISQHARFFPVMVRSPETNNHVLVG